MSPRFRMGFRERLQIIPGIVWINFSRSGTSLSVHLGFATWNSRRGWYIHGPAGIYWRERRSRT